MTRVVLVPLVASNVMTATLFPNSGTILCVRELGNEMCVRVVDPCGTMGVLDSLGSVMHVGVSVAIGIVCVVVGAAACERFEIHSDGFGEVEGASIFQVFLVVVVVVAGSDDVEVDREQRGLVDVAIGALRLL